MKNALIALLLFSSAAMADKNADKGRVDDCFLDLMSIARDVNEHMGKSDQWKFNRQFSDKQKRCLALEKSYVKAHGKYVLPKGN